jgi:glycosyltransferase involved in cell wall biosynthesis
MEPNQPLHNPLEGDRPDMVMKLHDGTEEQISIIVVHKDRPEYLNICLQSITVASFNNNYEIIVVDNASGADTQDFLEEIKDEAKIIRNSENLYWGPAANKGAEAANPNSKYLVFLHADVVVLNPAWLDLLVNVANSTPCGCVGLDLQSYFLQNQKIDFVQEWLLLVTQECWKDAGPFDERLPQIGAPFIFTVKAQRAGHKPQVMRNPLAHHYRVFGVNVNEHERFTEQAMVTIPKILREIQSGHGQ